MLSVVPVCHWSHSKTPTLAPTLGPNQAPHGDCLTGRVWQTVTGANLASTLEEVCLRCTDDSPCYGFSILNGTAAKIFSKIHGTHAPAPGTSCVSGKYGYHWGGAVGVPIGGYW